jgi:hypothetical protein
VIKSKHSQTYWKVNPIVEYKFIIKSMELKILNNNVSNNQSNLSRIGVDVLLRRESTEQYILCYYS